MTATIAPFSYKNQQVRTVLIDGDPWFVAADITSLLGYGGGARNAIARLPERMKGVAPINTLGGVQQMTVVNEAGFNRLVLRSSLAEAEEIQDWVAETVLPEIRKTGSYGAQPAALTREQRLAVGMEAAQEVIAEQKVTIAEQAAQIAELEPSASNWDLMVARNGDIDIRAAAQWLSKIPGIETGQNRLFSTLKHQLRWIDKKNRPYQHIVERGLLSARYDGEWTDPVDGSVHIKTTTMATMKGLVALRKALSSQLSVVSA